MPQMPATAATSVSPPAMTVTIRSRATRALRLQHVTPQRIEGKEQARLCKASHSFSRAGISLPLVELYVDQVLCIINGLLKKIQSGQKIVPLR